MYKKVNDAHATIYGSQYAPNLYGHVDFYSVANGSEVFVEVWGLPLYEPALNDDNPIGPFGFHIHEYGICQITNPQEPFESAGGHWNPDDYRSQPAGDSGKRIGCGVIY